MDAQTQGERAQGREAAPRVFTIPPGVPFLPALAAALAEGRLVPGFEAGRGDPLALASATIYVPTRRAARELRAAFANLEPGLPAILPTVKALGEFEEDAGFALGGAAEALDLAPPVPAMDRLLMLAPLVQQWKRFLPGYIREKFAEEVEVPVSSADAVWLARDLAVLMDEIESEETDWSRLEAVVEEADLSGWWKVTLDFLGIVSKAWPGILAERGWSNPAAHRNAMLRLEAARLLARPPAGPVIAAGSTGSNPAAAALFATIARLPDGAVVLPGFDTGLDAPSWTVLSDERPEPAVLGHPQFGLAKILRRMDVPRTDVRALAAAPPALATRARAVAEALRPAATTDLWAERRGTFPAEALDAALAGVTLIEAPTERDEALAIAAALRLAVAEPERSAALVTGDRDLARRVAAELGRFGIRADDSGGTPLSRTPPGQLLALMLACAFQPGDPVAILALLKHPLLRLGLERDVVRRAAEAIELVAFRGGAGRPGAASLSEHFERRLAALAAGRPPFWLRRLGEARLDGARDVARRLEAALEPLAALGAAPLADFAALVLATVTAWEALGRAPDGGVEALYGGDAGRAMAAFLREMHGARAGFALPPAEWPQTVEALVAETVVRPAPQASERRVAIWGLLEARLQSVDTLVVGGLNEGAWPPQSRGDRFLSRVMKGGIDLEPPERRIGLAAHDFQMAMGAETLVLARAARTGDAPSVRSRWLQRLLTFAGPQAEAAMKTRGDRLLRWTELLDEAERIDFEARPEPKPPVAMRPTHFSVTEIETLRRDPYAIYAKKVLGLEAIEPLIREPGPAERGRLFHEILHRFSASTADPAGEGAHDALVTVGRACFDEAALPADVEALWWPRFLRMAGNVVAWERGREREIVSRHPEAQADRILVGATGVTLSGRADRIDLAADGRAEVIDFKTGSSPSKGQAHTLLSPQLALEAALLKRGAFAELGPREPADLLFMRLKADGAVEPESILKHGNKEKTADALAEEAWSRLESLLAHYADPDAGYKSRALPFKEGDTNGTYDHLARVLEWSAGGEAAEEGGEA